MMSLRGYTMDQDNNRHVDSSLADTKNTITTDHKPSKLSSSPKSSLDFKKYTKQIWLAGLGAFSRAEEEGNKLFDSLVKVGEELESSSAQPIDTSNLKTTSFSSKINIKSQEKKEKVERILDQGVQHSLNRIGLVSTKDIQRLETLILQLHQKVDQLNTDSLELRSKLKHLSNLKE